MAEEHEFPTINDAAACLQMLAEKGLGELPVQILIVPDSTLQAIARNSGAAKDSRPALMVDLGGIDGRMSFSLISAGWIRRGMPTESVQ